MSVTLIAADVGAIPQRLYPHAGVAFQSWAW